MIWSVESEMHGQTPNLYQALKSNLLYGREFSCPFLSVQRLLFTFSPKLSPLSYLFKFLSNNYFLKFTGESPKQREVYFANQFAPSQFLIWIVRLREKVWPACFPSILLFSSLQFWCCFVIIDRFSKRSQFVKHSKVNNQTKKLYYQK